MQSWDYLILTVNNRKQKKIAKYEIQKRKENLLNTKIIIKKVKKNENTGKVFIDIIKKLDLKNKKIIYIPSAGLAKRTFYYFKKGKVWIETKKSKTIFDEILENTKTIFKKMKSGILVCCSDVVLKINEEIQGIDEEKINIFLNKNDVEIAKKHGVFKVENRKIVEVIQKPSIKTLKEKGYIKNKKVYLDTGTIYFPKKILNKLKNKKIRDKNYGIYENLIPELLQKQLLNGIILEDSEFTHYGTTKDILEIKGNKNNSYIENSGFKNMDKIKNSLIINCNINEYLPDNSIMYTTKISRKRYVTILLNIEDDIKEEVVWNIKMYKPARTEEEAIKRALSEEEYKNCLSIKQILKKEII